MRKWRNWFPRVRRGSPTRPASNLFASRARVISLSPTARPSRAWVSAGVQQDSVLELARLNQLGLWSGEAEALRLSGLSDQVVLAVARRRAAGQPSLSSPKIAALKNAGLNETQIPADINNGVSDAQADRIIAERNYANGGHTFVSQRRRRR